MLSKAKAAEALDVKADEIMEMGERKADGATVVILSDYRKFVIAADGRVTPSVAVPAAPAAPARRTGLVMSDKAKSKE